MEVFGFPISTIYIALLFISGIFVLLYALFGDIIEGLDEGIPFLNPILIGSFVIFVSAIGYVLEIATSWSSVIILVIAAIAGFLLTTCLHLFVLVPMRSAEHSLAISDETLKGKIGKTIISIPEDGFGEVLLESVSGRIAKSAKSFDGKEIPADVQVLVVKVEDGVLYVIPYEDAKIYQ